MNLTQAQYEELCQRAGASIAPSEDRRVGLPKPKRPEPVSGPLSVLLVLHGHCPGKKNGWRSTGDGKMFIPAEMKSQIGILTTQALFQWAAALSSRFGPVEHPDVTVRFFVSAARQDEDGMWTTVLDCLQKAGVIVNDNIKHFNGRKVHEPCVFVAAADERVEILICKS